MTCGRTEKSGKVGLEKQRSCGTVEGLARTVEIERVRKRLGEGGGKEKRTLLGSKQRKRGNLARGGKGKDGKVRSGKMGEII